MKPKHYLILFVIGLAFILVEAALTPVPGYMDAEYYYAGGSQLAGGRGFNEPFLWNFLDDPASLPHPAFTYWMPLTSLLAGLSMVVSGKINFFSGRLLFFLVAAAIPPLTAYLSWKLSRRFLAAWLAGGLAIFSGFYAIYMGLTDTFALYMLLGSLFLILAVSSQPRPIFKFMGLGLIAGLMHLARADGILWLGAAIFLVVFEPSNNVLDRAQKIKHWAAQIGMVMVGYLLIMAPWYWRNLSLYGALFSPASGRALWLTDYNQMFDFPASLINLQGWLNSGLITALNDRLSALWLNAQTTLAVQADIFLFPLLLAGLWRLRKERIIRIGMVLLALTFLIMTIVFPLAGGRGGFFHSGAALQPIIWAVAIEGFLAVIEFGVKKRGWKFERATQGFGSILMFLSLMLSAALFLPQVAGDSLSESPWTKSNSTYRAVEQYLLENGAGQNQIVMVNNSPGYFVATGRSAIVIPNGDTSTVLAVAVRYGVSYLVLEQNSVQGLQSLYQNPVSSPGLQYMGTVDQAQVFRIEKP